MELHAIKCANCGAPITQRGRVRCDYCRSELFVPQSTMPTEHIVSIHGAISPDADAVRRAVHRALERVPFKLAMS